MGFHALAVDEDVVVDDFDEDRTELALPDPAQHAVAGQGKRRLCVVSVSDNDIDGRGQVRIHGDRGIQERLAGSATSVLKEMRLRRFA